MQTSHSRFAALLGALLVGGIGLIALHAGTKRAFDAAYAMTTAVLLVASAAAWFCRRGAGIFWFGFAITGWALLWLGFGPWLSVPPNGEERFNSLVNECLLTTRLLKDLDNTLVAGDDLERIGNYGYNLAIGHALLTLLLAECGGLLGLRLRRVAARRYRRPTMVVDLARCTRHAFVVVAVGGAVLAILIAQIPSGFGVDFSKRDDSAAQDLAPVPRGWYRKHLAAMHEPALRKPAPGDRLTEVYRLLWLPTFHHPVCVRLTRSGDTVMLHVVVLDGLGGYGPGAVAVDRTSRVSSGQWNEFLRLADAAPFWAMPSKDPTEGGTDGDQLFLEAVKDGRYHAVDRWEADREYAALCKYLLDLSGIRYQRQWDEYH